MIRSFSLVTLWACLFFMALSGVAAHSRKAAITRVVLNERTGVIEVMHRFSLHDAEHAAPLMWPEEDTATMRADVWQTAFASYVAERFSLRYLGGEAVPLTLVGQEVEGEFLWVYQEAPLGDGLAFEVTHRALRDIWPTQANMVNFEFRGVVRTVTFTGEVVVMPVDLNAIRNEGRP
ncbi:DUF6702 family protein [Kordiimonas sp.]|uniref:DUF6702 family protein n=1 Tax=Kordiimonas sp. TaxID=1970157 RepID=UPI003A8D0FD3